MRIVGAADYYDGMAFGSDGRVLSMLVYHRTDRLSRDRDMRRALGLDRPVLDVRLRTADGMRLLRLPVGPVRHRWNGSDVTVRPARALFCGRLHQGAVVTVTTEWSSTRTWSETRWCWSSDSLEEELASFGLVVRDERHRPWFGEHDVSDAARRIGVATATFDPTDPSHRRGRWRLDAPTLGRMGFRDVVAPREALTSLAQWSIGASGTGRLRVRPAADAAILRCHRAIL